MKPPKRKKRTDEIIYQICLFVILPLGWLLNPEYWFKASIKQAYRNAMKIGGYCEDESGKENEREGD